MDRKKWTKKNGPKKIDRKKMTKKNGPKKMDPKKIDKKKNKKKKTFFNRMFLYEVEE